MKTEKIIIQNLKCDGCANTVINSLKNQIGIQNIDVSIEKSMVSIDYEGEIERSVFVDILAAKGYPEVGGKNGTMKKAQSYISCLIGRM
jgi:copper chaperone CopZ